MGWTVYMKDKEGKIVQVPNHFDGGTVKLFTRHELAIPGTEEVTGVDVYGSQDAEMTVTFNYSGFYREHFGEESLNALYGLTGEEAIPALLIAVKALGTRRDGDYWKATEGNAGYALSVLLAWARLHPSATFVVH